MKEPRTFWRWAKVGEKEECWEWQGHKTAYSLVTFFKWNRTLGARRSDDAQLCAWEITNKEQLESTQRITMLCGNKLCVNPGHMEASKKRPSDHLWNKPKSGMVLIDEYIQWIQEIEDEEQIQGID